MSLKKVLKKESSALDSNKQTNTTPKNEPAKKVEKPVETVIPKKENEPSGGGGKGNGGSSPKLEQIREEKRVDTIEPNQESGSENKAVTELGQSENIHAQTERPAEVIKTVLLPNDEPAVSSPVLSTESEASAGNTAGDSSQVDDARNESGVSAQETQGNESGNVTHIIEKKRHWGGTLDLSVIEDIEKEYQARMKIEPDRRYVNMSYIVNERLRKTMYDKSKQK